MITLHLQQWQIDPVTNRPINRLIDEFKLVGFDRLTPRAARVALELAFGNSDNGLVWWGGNYGYSVFKTSAKKRTSYGRGGRGTPL